MNIDREAVESFIVRYSDRLCSDLGVPRQGRDAALKSAALSLGKSDWSDVTDLSVFQENADKESADDDLWVLQYSNGQFK